MTTTPTIPDRRERHRVREIFAQACELLEPVVTANDKVKVMSDFAMTHMLTEHFPEISLLEAHIVIVTVEKLHKEKRLQAILNKKG